jgi:hypothetical protein
MFEYSPLMMTVVERSSWTLHHQILHPHYRRNHHHVHVLDDLCLLQGCYLLEVGREVCQRRCWRDHLRREVELDRLDSTSSWLQVVKLQIRSTWLWYQLKGSRCRLEGVNSRTWKFTNFLAAVRSGSEFPDTPGNLKNLGKCPDCPTC